jgi:hypothetical protein
VPPGATSPVRTSASGWDGSVQRSVPTCRGAARPRRARSKKPRRRWCIHELLVSHGYKLIDDAWDEYGRLTYLHDDDADRAYLKELAQKLGASGWERAKSKLRTFHHPASQYEIELEPGGSETTGHFLHFMRPQP